MVDILHRVGIQGATLTQVYDALTTVEGLSGWWTTDTSGSTETGGVLQFRFPPGGFDMKVLEQVPDEHLRWLVVDGPEEWIGTTVDWQLRTDGDFTIVMFKHEGWKEPVEFMHHCSTKWATYLLSLKALIEDDHGRPAPDDLHIAYPD
ncbi:MAG TPA: SRPBCC domain-containing protein [Propionicimonas sp.]